jgi:hypothetical protein
MSLLRLHQLSLPKSELGIMITDESDATDKEIGLDGRIPLLDLAIANPKLKLNMAKDDNIGINLVHTSELKVKDINYSQINRLDLIFPQGKSEKYKHHRMTSKIEFPTKLRNHYGLDGIIIVAQHNSAFIRPFARAIQSANGMKIALQKQKGEP